MATVKLLGADDQAGDATSGSGIINFQKFTASTTGTLTEFYVKVPANGNFDLAVYADNAGVPGALLGYKNAVALSAGWSASTGWSIPVVASSIYWLATLWSVSVRYNNSGGTRGYKSQAYDPDYGWPDPWTAALTYDAILVICAGWETEGPIGLHFASAQRRYKAATFSTFAFPDPAGTGFTAATDSYSMFSGWGTVGVFGKVLSGTLNIAGSLGRKIYKTLAGTLTPTGALSATKRFFQTLYGTINFSGTLAGLRLVVLAGTLNLSGTLGRLTRKNISGTLNLSGALTGGITWFKSLAGTLNLSGALSTFQRFSKTLAGTLNLTGSLGLLVKKRLAGVLTSSGTLGRNIFKKLAGTLNLSGALGYGLPVLRKALSGTLNFSGNVGRKIKKTLAGALSFIGAIISVYTSREEMSLRLTDSSGNMELVLEDLADDMSLYLTETSGNMELLLTEEGGGI